MIQASPQTTQNTNVQPQQQQQQQHTNTSGSSSSLYVGPYKLEKTLGKGQTGLVKLGVHYRTGKKVAIKIVNREKLNESVLMKVEREITIMKLIEHPHVLKLYDVYENKKYLYLILEHVSGGELFDYLVKKSRLTIKEARKFFKQIISALDFCHSHLICHRDLKPENLLLDDKLNIKIADFGMASLQVEGSMLETSCGSPHYACPEVIRGEKYDGRKADVWSCGVILYALLVGALPFDDDNLKHLLEKIKKGYFQIPPYVPPECQELLRAMIEVDANKRLTLEEVSKHSWVLAGSKEEVELELPVSHVVQTAIIPSINEIDTDVLSHMTSLGSFKDRAKLIDALLNERHNIEKVIYFLLLERKLKMPSNEDDDELIHMRTRMNNDAPKKRVDKYKSPTSGRYSQLTIGSPDVGRRGLIINQSSSNTNQNGHQSSNYIHVRHNSCHTTPLQSPCTSPLMPMKLDFNRFNHHNHHQQQQQQRQHQVGYDTPNSMLNASIKSIDQQSSSSSQSTSNNFNQQIRSRINSFKNSVFTPKFYRRNKMQTPEKDSSHSTHHQAPPSGSTTPDQSRSWFQRWNLNKQDSSSGTSVNSLINQEQRDKEYIYTINDRPLNNIKADLIHAFLSTSDLIHNINSPNLFRCEYRSPDKFLSRNVRFKVEIIQDSCLPTTPTANSYQTYKIHFTLMSGSTKQFLNLCQHIVNLISTNQYASQLRQQRNINTNPRQVTTANTSAVTSSSTTTATTRRNSNTNNINSQSLQTPSPSSTSSSSSSTSSSVSLPQSPYVNTAATPTTITTSRSRKNSITSTNPQQQQQQAVPNGVASPSVTSLNSTYSTISSTTPQPRSAALSAISIKAALFTSLTNSPPIQQPTHQTATQATAISTNSAKTTKSSSNSSTSLFSSSILDFF